MRGRTNIHPLLIFLAVFGGIGWLGLPGALIGPVMVAFFLALYLIYAEDYLGQVPAELVPSDRSASWTGRLIGRGRRLLELAGIRKAGEVEPKEPPASEPAEVEPPPAATPPPLVRSDEDERLERRDP
jgi:hypothetical protein